MEFWENLGSLSTRNKQAARGCHQPRRLPGNVLARAQRIRETQSCQGKPDIKLGEFPQGQGPTCGTACGNPPNIWSAGLLRSLTRNPQTFNLHSQDARIKESTCRSRRSTSLRRPRKALDATDDESSESAPTTAYHRSRARPAGVSAVGLTSNGVGGASSAVEHSAVNREARPGQR